VSLLYTAKQYVKYLLRAKNLHGVHSPFVYEFNEQVLNDKRSFYAYKEIADLRSEYSSSSKIIAIEDMGAGSHKSKSAERTVSSIVNSAARKAKYGELLFRIQNHYQYKTVVELGTSLGIGLSYLAKADTSATIHSIEGSAQISSLAQQCLGKVGIDNVRYYVGNFDIILPKVLREIAQVNCAVVDGNHRYEPTISYFNLLWPQLASHGLLIFDDIYWSKGMTQAWEHIKSTDEVFITIDLFQFGLVFKHPHITTKQHFTLRF
jgi:predicted O-methyltransferase YrrM